jgi:UDPglucose 6-dehydrogenase
MSITVRNIACIGAGYVGGPTMAVIADKCPSIHVTVVDVDAARIAAWKEGPIPVVEPQLEDIVVRARARNLEFSTDLQRAIETADLIFIAVGTPTKLVGTGAGRACLVDYVEQAARSIGAYAKKDTIVIEKSTVPVGLSRTIRTLLVSNATHGIKFQILSNPEFLAEGTAIRDLLNPDRILIGHEKSPAGESAAEALISVYSQWVDRSKILTTNVWSSELAKLTANAFLAQRVSSINAISVICEKTGADVKEVAAACGADVRIGNKFLNASVGFGGSCFQKDVLNLVYIAETLGLTEVARYWQSVVDMNNFQRERFAHDIVHTMFDTLLNKRVTIFGFAFKAGTADTRESSAIYVSNLLLAEGAIVHIYDPKVTEQQVFLALNNLNAEITDEVLRKQVKVFKDKYQATVDSHALIVLTECENFQELDYEKIYGNMTKPAFVFDGRNVVPRDRLRKLGFCTHGIGVAPDSLAD